MDRGSHLLTIPALFRYFRRSSAWEKNDYHLADVLLTCVKIFLCGCLEILIDITWMRLVSRGEHSYIYANFVCLIAMFVDFLFCFSSAPCIV